MDIITEEQRSRNMAAIRSRNTRPELYMRKLLFSMGYRYSINSKKVSGHPDIYLKNIIQQYLLTAVFGTGMKVVNIHICQNPELSFGRKSLR